MMKTFRNLNLKKFPMLLVCTFPNSLSVKTIFSEFVCNQIADAVESLARMVPGATLMLMTSLCNLMSRLNLVGFSRLRI